MFNLLYNMGAGIQQSIISLSNVVVQANVNIFGSTVMAGFGAYSE